MLAIVGGCYISRRKHLLRLGVTILSQHVQLRLGLRYDLLPDENALEAYQELSAVGINIDENLRPRDMCPIFHHALQVRQMEYLYQAGFRDINAVDKNGYTPIHCLPGAPYAGDDLELTHTCCWAEHWSRRGLSQGPPTYGILFRAFDKNDAIEIHDEKRILLADFEDLVEQLNADYTASGLPLWEFLETHWSHKVMDYLSQNGETIRVDSHCNLLGKKIVEEA
ncbi:hypothetical protein BJX62DRAFT_231928 [Aspergillus germanicus]